MQTVIHPDWIQPDTHIFQTLLGDVEPREAKSSEIYLYIESFYELEGQIIFTDNFELGV